MQQESCQSLSLKRVFGPGGAGPARVAQSTERDFEKIVRAGKWVKKSHRAKNKLRKEEAKVAVALAKSGQPCMDCRGLFPAVCLDFDHRPGTEKRVLVSKAKTKSEALREMAKCDLVCANCHRIRTEKRRLAAL